MKAISLGELEKQIMDIVWEHKKCSVRDVLNSLGKERKLAYTTVATILQRLCEKSFLERREKGVSYIYSPKISKEKYSKNIARAFLKKFMESFGDAAVASFAESIDKLPEEKRKNLLRLIEKYEKNR